MESKCFKYTITALRIALGWLMLYAGLSKLTTSNWSAAGYLQGAKTFPAFYHYLTLPSILPIINLVNEWGLTLLGISLIFGVFVRLSSVLGAVLMLLYYFPVLSFPYIGSNYYLVDDHIIYAIVLSLFAVIGAGRYFGIDAWIIKQPFCRKILS